MLVALEPLGQVFAAGAMLSANGASALHTSLGEALRAALQILVMEAASHSLPARSHCRMPATAFAVMLPGTRVGRDRKREQDCECRHGPEAEAGCDAV